MHGDEARAEAIDAGIVLVAVALVDVALAAKFGFLRQHRHAERLLAAVAAAFADEAVDHHPLGRVDDLAALAAAAFFGRADLVEDQHRGALDLAQALLRSVELLAVEELDAAGKDRTVGPLADVIRQQHDRVDTLAAHLVGDLRHGQWPVHRLPAGHRDHIVVEDLVGDVDAGRDRLADRERARMEVGAVAEVLEHMRRRGERGLPRPGDAFAAHVGVGIGAAVHPRDHVVATDAAERAAAFGHHGRGVVRAARAVVRHARERGARQGELGFLVLHPAQHAFHLLAVARSEQIGPLDAAGDHAGDARRREFAGRRQDPLAGLVVLADDRRALATVPVVHRLLHLVLDEGVLLLDHEDVLQAARECAYAYRFQRPGHADLVDADAEVAAGRLAQAEVFERLQHVQIRLAGGDDAQPRGRRIDHDAVDVVGARERLRGLDRVLVQAHFLVERRVRPADVEAAGGHREIGRDHDVERERVHVDRGRRLDRLGDRLEADPAAGVTRHRPAQQAHVEDVLHARRVQDRDHRAGEFALAAVRQGRAAAGVVVGGEREHATELRRAGGIGVLEHVTTAVDPGALAVPHAVHALDRGAREQVGLLRAPDHRRAEVLVETRDELHPGRLEVLLRAPQLEVEATQRAAAVAGDKAAGVEPRGLVAQPLHQRQPHQRLHARQVDATVLAGVLVLERVVGIQHAVGKRSIRGRRRAEFGGAGHGVAPARWRPRDGWAVRRQGRARPAGTSARARMQTPGQSPGIVAAAMLPTPYGVEWNRCTRGTHACISDT